MQESLSIVSIELGLKSFAALKRYSELNNINKNKLVNIIVNSWDGDIKLFKRNKIHAIANLLEEYENVRLKGVQQYVSINKNINLKLINILNNDKYIYYTKPTMVRDILFGFIFFKDKKLTNILKKKNINYIDCIDILTFIPEPIAKYERQLETESEINMEINIEKEYDIDLALLPIGWR